MNTSTRLLIPIIVSALLGCDHDPAKDSASDAIGQEANWQDALIHAVHDADRMAADLELSERTAAVKDAALTILKNRSMDELYSDSLEPLNFGNDRFGRHIWWFRSNRVWKIYLSEEQGRITDVTFHMSDIDWDGTVW